MPRIVLQSGQVLEVARVGELVQIDNLVFRVPLENQADKIRTDESSAAGHQQFHGLVSFPVKIQNTEFRIQNTLRYRASEF